MLQLQIIFWATVMNCFRRHRKKDTKNSLCGKMRQLLLTKKKKTFLESIVLLDGEWLFYSRVPAVEDFDSSYGSVTTVGVRRFDFLDNVPARDDLSEHNVTSVQPGSFLGGDEELRSIGVFASVGHGQPARSVVGQLEVLIFKFVTVNAGSTSSISLGVISSLDHEVFDDSVEFAALVTLTNRTFGKFNKVGNSLGNSFTKQTNFYFANVNITDFDLEPYNVCDFGSGGFLLRSIDGDKQHSQQNGSKSTVLFGHKGLHFSLDHLPLPQLNDEMKNEEELPVL
uniref:Uncharacterized protein n=1 Tax=Cacopsylla melanoneura TaxID=428564 RepID=A0A8D8XNA6_9HEMI